MQVRRTVRKSGAEKDDGPVRSRCRMHEHHELAKVVERCFLDLVDGQREVSAAAARCVVEILECPAQRRSFSAAT